MDHLKKINLPRILNPYLSASYSREPQEYIDITMKAGELTH